NVYHSFAIVRFLFFRHPMLATKPWPCMSHFISHLLCLMCPSVLDTPSRISATIAGTVFRRTPTSSQNEHCREYAISKRIISLNVVLFFPLTCQSPVIPGSVSHRLVCHNLYSCASYGIHGRGPTR